MTAQPIRAVLFDLDDTLLDQGMWVRGAWDAVVGAALPFGVDPLRLRFALREIRATGSDRGDTIDRALELIGRDDIAVAPLLAAFRGYDPDHVTPYDGVADALELLHRHVATGLVTDGDATVQRNKLRATGLEPHFDVIVFSDKLGREHRKPSPAPLLAALLGLGIEANAAVHVGDRPDEDVAAATAAGMRSVRVRTGEFAHLPDDPQPWATAPDATGAIDGLLQFAFASAR